MLLLRQEQREEQREHQRYWSLDTGTPVVIPLLTSYLLISIGLVPSLQNKYAGT